MSYEIRDSRSDIEQSFLQSPEWERFQQALGNSTFRVGESLFVVHNLPIVGKYAYSPRGPNSGLQETQGILREMAREAKKRGCAWIRIEPSSKEELGQISDLLVTCHLPLVTCRRDIQPREILVADISKSEENLFSEMKPKTRYNIRLAEKKGVKVIVSKEVKYQERFIELVRETADRAGIRPHTKEHYLKMFETLGDSVELYSAEYDGKIIASNMMIFFGDGAIYLHGGSSNEYRNVMAPFLLQWKAICDAKKKGCVWYDLGGVAIESNKQQVTSNDTEKNVKCQMSNVKCLEWKGITKFKQGFCPGTASTQFPGTWDIVISPLRYRVYRFLQVVKRGI